MPVGGCNVTPTLAGCHMFALRATASPASYSSIGMTRFKA
jgi:hypothetical protein